MKNHEILIHGAKELGVSLSSKQVEQFEKYKDLLVCWNEKMNLTAITDDREIIIKHFLDCISSSAIFDYNKVAKLIDVGTGAGFPGMPLKITHPHIEVTLLDSLQKRLNFLQEVITQIGVQNIYTVHSRAEDGGQNPLYREQYDVCVSRAVANLTVLAEYCIPFIKKGGYFLAQKGPMVLDEIPESKKALSELGTSVVEVKQVQVPYSEATHYIVIMEKTKNTPPKYPRKAGVPAKSPIK